MSLVAYGSSDDSEGTDTDDVQPSASSMQTSVAFNKNSNAKHTAVSVDQISDSDDSDRETPAGPGQESTSNLLAGLPEPKSGFSSVTEETDILEDEVKPKASQVADIPKPAPKKGRQPVRITIPALPDSDEEDEPAKKKPRVGLGSGKSGLTSLLPPPVHATKKEANRILLPYSLTKKSQSNTTTKPKPPLKVSTATVKSGIVSSLAKYGSDSDEEEEESDEPVNFFSLGSDRENNEEVVTVTESPAERLQQVDKRETNVMSDRSVSTVPLPPGPIRGSLKLPAPTHKPQSETVKHSAHPNVDSVTSKNVSYSDDSDSIGSTTVSSNAPTVDPDAPLIFKGGVTKRHPSLPATSQDVGPMLPEAQAGYSNYDGYGAGSYPEPEDVEGYQQDQEFLRLQGKQQRGREEINIINVNADDFTDPSEIMKNMTEEQSYQSHKKNGDQPSSQQRRKHQIGYLAFQAKERELELKNQWSQNKMTRKQTQAKYGF
ncbi:PRCC-like protein [Mya arenaria]|uniref:PRCC-like protein n=1 Tax=Mya arenaria TaxID=6604 RepID=A0ABY7DRB8_MYAAR|nr:proline-rich protein PRCC-like [Mya arenaria]WAR00245.1 PRCC-like protein [Mya arenaria]